VTNLVASMAPPENMRSIETREQQVCSLVARWAQPSEFCLVPGGAPRTQWACTLVNAYLADRG
jgi:hypothetical protein